jgi:hypothetical protein
MQSTLIKTTHFRILPAIFGFLLFLNWGITSATAQAFDAAMYKCDFETNKMMQTSNQVQNLINNGADPRELEARIMRNCMKEKGYRTHENTDICKELKAPFNPTCYQQ